jgi:hypothetical protein
MPISGDQGQQSTEDINNKGKREGDEKCDKTLNLQNNFLRARYQLFSHAYTKFGKTISGDHPRR